MLWQSHKAWTSSSRLMQRRDFITLLGGAAAAWPLPARSEQADKVPRVGALMGFADTDPIGLRRFGAFKKGLEDAGWTEGRNLTIDVRWTADDPEKMRAYAAELVKLKPDALLGSNTPGTAALLQETRAIPIVFAPVADPVGSGFVESLPRPGGNATGFISFESSLVGKWSELLKEVAPQVTRAALLYNPDMESLGGAPILRTFEAAAAALALEAIALPVHDDAGIETGLAALARDPRSGLVVPADIFILHRRDLIVALVGRHRVPAVYALRELVTAGGLISYGVDPVDLYRRGAVYVDRILRGAEPAELPVQAPIKFELVINLKTSKALGLTIPPLLLARADEVIE
jgi:putative tryptophan/tyrosine transport system substrate-binding protein